MQTPKRTPQVAIYGSNSEIDKFPRLTSLLAPKKSIYFNHFQFASIRTVVTPIGNTTMNIELITIEFVTTSIRIPILKTMLMKKVMVISVNTEVLNKFGNDAPRDLPRIKLIMIVVRSMR